MTSPRPGIPALLLAGVPAVAFLFGLFPLWDYDIWGHLAAARLILETGRVPRVDPFLWGITGRPWTDLYWLFQLGAWGLHRLGGASLLVVAKAALAALAAALSLAARRPGTGAGLAALVWLAPLVVVGGRTYERPEMVSLVLLAAFLCVIARAESRPGLLWILPGLQLVWVNSHPFFAFGPLLALLFALDAPVTRAVGLLAPESRVPVRRRWIALGLVTAACFANPYLVRGALFPLGVVFGQGADHLFYRQFVAELRPVSFFLSRDPTNPYLLAFLATFALGVAGALPALVARRLSFYRAAILVLFGLLGWSATRNVAFFALAYATVTIWNVHDAAAARRAARPPSLRGERRRERRDAVPARDPARAFDLAAAVGVAGLILAIVSGALYAWAGEGRVLGLGERQGWYTHAAQRFLVSEGMPRRAFVSSIGEANLTLFEGEGRVRVFMDPRLEVATRALFEEYVAVVRAMNAGDTATWEKILARPQEAERWPSILLDRARSARAIAGVLAAPGWRPVYADDLAVVFLRDEAAQRRGLPRVSP